MAGSLFGRSSHLTTAFLSTVGAEWLTYFQARRPVTVALAMKSRKFYAVHKGRGGYCGVKDSWSQASDYISGVPGVLQKSFQSRADAEYFAKHGRSPQSQDSGAALGSAISKPSKKVEPRRKALSTTRSSRTVVKEETSDQSQRKVCVNGDKSSPWMIYTDGACESNGRAGAIAGVGVFFSDGDPRNVSERLAGSQQTNNRAEMTAVIRALEAIHHENGTGDAVILTDSNYVLQGLREWVAGWKKRSWKKADGQPVKNKDLWEELDTLQAKVKAIRNLEIRWVRGHSGIVGNEMADQLAVAGAHKL